MNSQNDEEKYILEFFYEFKGTLLSIGENDGVTFSNSNALIKLGWNADLVEPSPRAIEKLKNLYCNNTEVNIYPIAIGEKTETLPFHDSGTHLNNGDTSLLSTLVAHEKERWKDTEWNVIFVDVFTYENFKKNNSHEYDFISIDAESLDIIILKQIDLTHTKLLCIEWNSIEQNKIDILEYTSKFGINKIIYQSGENLLICREQ